MSPLRRVRLTFGVLVAVAVAGVGILGRALTWPPSPAAGITVALSGLLAAAAGGLALRIVVVVDRGRPGPGTDA